MDCFKYAFNILNMFGRSDAFSPAVVDCLKAYHQHNLKCIEDQHRDDRPQPFKKEIKTISDALQDVGITIVPLKLFVNPKGWAKIDIALARGKKLHDKRHDLKAKDDKRQMDRAMKDFN